MFPVHGQAYELENLRRSIAMLPPGSFGRDLKANQLPGSGGSESAKWGRGLIDVNAQASSADIGAAKK